MKRKNLPSQHPSTTNLQAMGDDKSILRTLDRSEQCLNFLDKLEEPRLQLAPENVGREKDGGVQTLLYRQEASIT